MITVMASWRGRRFLGARGGLLLVTLGKMKIWSSSQGITPIIPLLYKKRLQALSPMVALQLDSCGLIFYNTNSDCLVWKYTADGTFTSQTALVGGSDHHPTQPFPNWK